MVSSLRTLVDRFRFLHRRSNRTRCTGNIFTIGAEKVFELRLEFLVAQRIDQRINALIHNQKNHRHVVIIASHSGVKTNREQHYGDTGVKRTQGEHDHHQNARLEHVDLRLLLVFAGEL